MLFVLSLWECRVYFIFYFFFFWNEGFFVSFLIWGSSLWAAFESIFKTCSRCTAMTWPLSLSQSEGVRIIITALWRRDFSLRWVVSEIHRFVQVNMSSTFTHCSKREGEIVISSYSYLVFGTLPSRLCCCSSWASVGIVIWNPSKVKCSVGWMELVFDMNNSTSTKAATSTDLKKTKQERFDGFGVT